METNLNYMNDEIVRERLDKAQDAMSKMTDLMGILERVYEKGLGKVADQIKSSILKYLLSHPDASEYEVACSLAKELNK